MGALPKRKLSGRRRGNRRSHINVALASMSHCPRCRSLTQSHRACPVCGFYRDRVAIEIPIPGQPDAQP